MFGKVLKEIRQKNGDSLRSLGNKINVFFTYIDKIEKGTNKINKNLLEKLITTYPLDEKTLVNAYIKEMLPEGITYKREDVEDIYLVFLKTLTLEERKNIYNNILEKVELSSLKNGSYENKREDIEKARKIMKKL